MVKSEDQLKKILDDYISLTKKSFYIKKIILFGSYANGNQTSESDIDLAIVSPDFEYLSYDVASKILFRMARYVDTSIEPVPMDVDEYENPSLGTVAYEVNRSGKIIFQE